MRKRIQKNSFEKILRIGVQYDGSKFVLLDGLPFPELVKGANAEIVVSTESFADLQVRDRLFQEQEMKFLGQGTSVLFGVSQNMLDGNHLTEANLKQHLLNPAQFSIITEFMLVEARLLGDLLIRIRADQEAFLLPCKCSIPALQQESISLNHAFTLISEKFETLRKSHTGNVFDRAWSRDDSGGWVSLADLRIRAIAKFSDKVSAAQP